MLALETIGMVFSSEVHSRFPGVFNSRCNRANRDDFECVDLTGYGSAINNPNLNREYEIPVIQAACRKVGSLMDVKNFLFQTYIAMTGGKRIAKIAQCLDWL